MQHSGPVSRAADSNIELSSGSPAQTIGTSSMMSHDIEEVKQNCVLKQMTAACNTFCRNRTVAYVYYRIKTYCALKVVMLTYVYMCNSRIGVLMYIDWK